LWEAPAAAYFERMLKGRLHDQIQSCPGSISLLAGVVQFSPSAWATDYLYKYMGNYGEFAYISRGGFVSLDVAIPLPDLDYTRFVPDLQIAEVLFDEIAGKDEIDFYSLHCRDRTCYLSDFPVGSFFAVGKYIGQDYNFDRSYLDVSEYTARGVPEASTWAMMLLGFGGIGFAGYLRPRKCPRFG
jgi:hypothetical protein